jgi:hypothetical protein
VVKVFECPSILFLGAPITNNFIGKGILKTVVFLCLYHGVILFIYY